MEKAMGTGAMCWRQQDGRTLTMELGEAGADWIEVKRFDAGAAPTWRVDARMNGSHYKVSDAFPTKEAAQGCALLLAMRQLPRCRPALHAQLDAVPGAWWWKILPTGDANEEQRSIFSSRVVDSPEAAERNGRAAGGGWWLYVYGPGVARGCGQVPR
jgi:hypothetical protein